MARKKFLRGKWRTYSKLGRGRKNKQKYRKAKGRHNKIRERKKGNPKRVEIGYKKPRKVQEIRINSIMELNRLKKGDRIIIGNIGKKKKLEMIKKTKEKGIEIINLNEKKFMKKIKMEKERKEKDKAKEEKKKEVKKKKKSEEAKKTESEKPKEEEK